MEIEVSKGYKVLLVHMGYKGPEVLHKMLAAVHGAHGGERIVVSPTAIVSPTMARLSTGGVVHELSSAQEAMNALDSSDKAILFLYAPWCHFCKLIKPIVDKLVAAGKRIGFPTFIKNFASKHAQGTGEEVSLGGRAKLLLHSGKKELEQFEAEML